MSRAKPPNILAVESMEGRRLHIHWRDHGEDVVDLSGEISTSRALAALRDPAFSPWLAWANTAGRCHGAMMWN